MAIDLADSRLQSALEFGADTTINSGSEDAVAGIMELTDGLGADVAFEAVGVGRVANIGVHGHSATLHLEKLVFATHRFTLGDTMAAYDTFADAANTHAQGRP